MKRRKFIYSTLGSASVGIIASCSVIKEQKISWKMATSWTENLEVLYGGVEYFCQRIRELTNSRFIITPYPAGKLVKNPLKIVDEVQQGNVECGHTSSYYDTSNPSLWFGSAVPFGLNAQEQNAWLYAGGGLKALQEIYAQLGVIIFPAGNTGGQMGGWFKKQIRTVSDLKDLRMRIPGLGGEVMKGLGVEPVNIAANEIYQALKNEEIDAAEFIGPYDDKKLGLHKVAPYYYYPGWWEPSSTFIVVINQNSWNRLPKEYQEIFKAVAAETNTQILARYDALNRTALQELKDGGTRVIRYDESIINQASRVANKLYEETASKDAQFRKIYEEWRRFKYQINNWYRLHQL
ncbi:MAG: TRAP transporter substrate-binding protein DctP [Nostocaceae cyanobacterium]|nr:TRAP transporter substrate-binding protein DctP [Nostocaceae cyanobacterium]